MREEFNYEQRYKDISSNNSNNGDDFSICRMWREKDTSSDGEYAKNLIVWDHLTADEHNALDPIIQKWGEDNGVKISFSNDQDDLQGYINAAKKFFRASFILWYISR